MTILIKPEKEELNYRRFLLKNKKTMAFCHQLIDFPEEEWDAFYEKWQNTSPEDGIYRQIYCDDCGFSVGEGGYHKENNDTVLDLLIQGDCREMGYGSDGLKLIEEEAKENGIAELYVKLAHDNPFEAFFLKRGYQEISDGAQIILKKVL